MKKVRFLVDTAYQGPRREGDVVTVPDDFAHRWVKNCIAEYEPEDEKEEVENELPGEDAPVEEQAEEVPDEVKLEDLSKKELYELCLEKGIKAQPKKSREYYLELLSK